MPMGTEHRAWITITGFPATRDEDRWTAFIAALERDANEYGPILSWADTNTAQVVMSCDDGNIHLAAQVFVRAIGRSLHETGLVDARMTAIEFELPDRSLTHA